MFEIKFKPWEIGTRPRGLKETEVKIFSDFMLWKEGIKGFYLSDEGTWRPSKPPQSMITKCCYAFQVYLLGGFPPPDTDDVAFAKDWEKITSLKADVIEKKGSIYTIYELKQRIDVAVLGQLLTYRWLFEEVFLYPKGTQLVAVGDFIVPGLIQPLLDNGIRVHVREFNWLIPSKYSAIDIRRESINISPA